MGEDLSIIVEKIQYSFTNQAWWCTSVILALERWRQEHQKFNYITSSRPALRPYLTANPSTL